MRTSGPLQPPPTQRPTPPWAVDISALETGALGDPSTFLVTALARTTAGPTSGDSIATLATNVLSPVPATPALSPPLPSPPRPIGVPHLTDSPDTVAGWGDRDTVEASILQHQQEAARLRRQADELQVLLQREAHATQTLFARYETLRRQAALSAREHFELQTLIVLLPQRSAQLTQWRVAVQQHVLDARTHEDAAASLLRSR
jgi:hypothetical protein